MSQEREFVYLAALLHDIGKFFQRADPNGVEQSTLLSQRIKNLEGSIAPFNPLTQKYSHKHVLWTAQFFENLSPHLNKYIQLNDGYSVDRLLRISSTHHAPNPNDLIEIIIQKSNHYSSGADRDKENGTGWRDAAEESDTNWDAFKRTRMRSVFQGVSLQNSRKKVYAYDKKLDITEMSTGEDFFPQDEFLEIPDYSSMWNKFITELRFIQCKTLRSFNDGLLFLLEKYTCRIPSSTQYLPDVSLYDHLKTTAAFALCLYDFIKINRGVSVPESSEKPFLLVGGAINGIQKYIYNIAARGAAKNLKGRSFYLQLLVDNIVQFLLDELRLQLGNVIYTSGGGFYLLASNTEEVKNIIIDVERRISKKIFNFHGVELSLSIRFKPFGETEIFKDQDPDISQIWDELGRDLADSKNQRYKHLITTEFEHLFEPVKVTTETQKDAITGELLASDHKKLDESDQNSNSLRINKYTWLQIELGKKLKNTDYWIMSRDELSYFPDYRINPIGIGYYNYFVSKEELSRQEYQLSQSADNVRVIYFNKENYLDPIHKTINNIYGFAWYGGNDYPENQFQEPKVFEELAGVKFDRPSWEITSKKQSGPDLTRLGILRMDVDNLGAIFRNGLEPGRRTFSRYSALSRGLDWFFKGYLNTIWHKNDDYSKYTQIIYSGGDDLFIVGKWDVLEKMAYDIQVAFRKWTCDNPDLTLSGGMAIVGPKFPILKSSAYSEKFEKAAKSHQYGSQKKNSFAFFSSQIGAKSNEELLVSLDWSHEYPYVDSLKKNIIELLENGLSEGFPSAMYNLMQRAEFKWNPTKCKYFPENLRVIWLAAYQFKRNTTKDNALNDFFTTWTYNIMSGSVSEIPDTIYHPLQLLAIAARLASFEQRTSIN